MLGFWVRKLEDREIEASCTAFAESGPRACAGQEADCNLDGHERTQPWGSSSLAGKQVVDVSDSADHVPKSSLA